MRITCKSLNGAHVVKVKAKRLDSANSERFKDRVIKYINDGRIHLAIDLSDVEFMDSMGLAALISTLKALTDEGDMAVFGLNQRLKRLFSITRLDRDVFKIAENSDQAVEMISRPE